MSSARQLKNRIVNIGLPIQLAFSKNIRILENKKATARVCVPKVYIWDHFNNLQILRCRIFD